MKKTTDQKRPMIKIAEKAFRQWNELLFLPLALVIFYFSPALIRFLDPTAAVFDAGILQKVIFVIVIQLIMNFFIWLLIKLSFPQLHDYFYNLFEFDILYESDIDKAVIHTNVDKKKEIKQNLLSEIRWERSKMALSVFVLFSLQFLVLFATL